MMLLKIVNQSMDNINQLIENNTWNCTIYFGDGNICYCRHAYFHCYCIFMNTLD